MKIVKINIEGLKEALKKEDELMQYVGNGLWEGDIVIEEVNGFHRS
jgi:hypothetical protein